MEVSAVRHTLRVPRRRGGTRSLDRCLEQARHRRGRPLVGFVVFALLSACGAGANSTLSTDAANQNWDGLSSNPSIGASAAIAWSGKVLLAYGGIRYGENPAKDLSSANDPRLYNPTSGEWRETAPLPSDPLLGARAAFVNGRFLLYGTQCPTEQFEVREADLQCAKGTGAAFWLTEDGKAWESVELPSWIAERSEGFALISRLNSLGVHDKTLYLGGTRDVVAFDSAQSQFNRVIGPTAGRLQLCMTDGEVVVLQTSHGTSQENLAPAQTSVINLTSNDVRDVPSPVAITDFSEVSCGSSIAHLFAATQEPAPSGVQAYELRPPTDERWSRSDNWPKDLQTPSLAARTKSGEFVWAVSSTTPVRTTLQTFTQESWTAVRDLPDDESLPYVAVDVGTGFVLQGGTKDFNDPLHFQGIS
jgi:hypothetical protein